jgi:hypothetical protein
MHRYVLLPSYVLPRIARGYQEGNAFGVTFSQRF